jgi:hypothetical protein
MGDLSIADACLILTCWRNRNVTNETTTKKLESRCDGATEEYGRVAGRSTPDSRGATRHAPTPDRRISTSCDRSFESL